VSASQLNTSAPIAGFTSNTVPWEILQAAGFAPMLLERDEGPTPLADNWMEDVFEGRIRVLFDRIATGAWNHLDAVVIPRTSEQEHKLYLYLREVERNGSAAPMPRLHLYNLPHTRLPESYAYGLERTRQLAADLNLEDEAALCGAIAESNRARAAIRKLLDFRERGLVEGSEAMRLIHGFYTMNRDEFARKLEATWEVFAGREQRARPRLLIKGSSLDHTGLHCAIESLGGFVAGEDDWRGSRAAGTMDVSTEGDPLIAIFEKYYLDTPSPRVFPAAAADAWFAARVAGGNVDGVVFHLPSSDDVAGWDYPRHLEFLRSKMIPSLLIRESGEPVSVELHGRLQDFINELGSAL
jgi:benzoyl-CoA reductase/2-hydroxyglutaryl-CoA dehydratase subunit BcrC/BadD/HgdB